MWGCLPVRLSSILDPSYKKAQRVYSLDFKFCYFFGRVVLVWWVDGLENCRVRLNLALFSLSWGLTIFLQKTRTQNIDIWPNDGHFMTIKKFLAKIFKIFKSQKNLRFLGFFF